MIRNASINDLDALCDLSTTYQALIPNAELSSLTKKWLKSHLDANSLCYVYERSNRILGFILAEKLIGNGLIIWTLAVLPECLSRGIGVKLHRHLERESLVQQREWIIAYVTEVSAKLCERDGYKNNNNQFSEVIKFLRDTKSV